MNNMKRFSFHFEIRYISSRSSNGEKKIATHSLLSLSLSPPCSLYVGRNTTNIPFFMAFGAKKMDALVEFLLF